MNQLQEAIYDELKNHYVISSTFLDTYSEDSIAFGIKQGKMYLISLGENDIRIRQFGMLHQEIIPYIAYQGVETIKQAIIKIQKLYDESVKTGIRI